GFGAVASLRRGLRCFREVTLLPVRVERRDVRGWRVNGGHSRTRLVGSRGRRSGVRQRLAGFLALLRRCFFGLLLRLAVAAIFAVPVEGIFEDRRHFVFLALPFRGTGLLAWRRRRGGRLLALLHGLDAGPQGCHEITDLRR